MTAYDIKLENIIAMSPGINPGETVGEGEEASREDYTNHPSTPNLWEQGW